MNRSSFTHSHNGSALLLTITFIIVVGIVSASFLDLALTTYKMAHNTSVQTASFYLAEAGIEEGAWALHAHETDQDWIDDGWTKTADGLFWQQSIAVEDEDLTLDFGNIPAAVRVLVGDPASGDEVPILTEGLISKTRLTTKEATGAVFGRMESKQFYPFKASLIARLQMSFNGQPTFDSYDSELGNYGQVVNGRANINENATVGSVSDANGSVSLGNGHVYGDVVSGAENPEQGAVSMKPQATVTGSIIGEYKQDFPLIQPPDTTGWPTSF